MKKVAIVQSNYIPWKGYFDLIASVDEFILYDDRQFTKRDWRNRNLIKTQDGLQWLSIPVKVKGKYFQSIQETEVKDKSWASHHLKVILHNYGKASYYNLLKEEITEWYVEASGMQLLSEINFHFINRICKKLNINTSLRFSHEFEVEGDRNQRLINLCKAAGANDYLSGPSAKSYLQESEFLKNNIQVSYMDYHNYPEYNQLFPPFKHEVSILDLLFNAGHQSGDFLKHINQK